MYVCMYVSLAFIASVPFVWVIGLSIIDYVSIRGFVLKIELSTIKSFYSSRNWHSHYTLHIERLSQIWTELNWLISSQLLTSSIYWCMYVQAVFVFDWALEQNSQFHILYISHTAYQISSYIKFCECCLWFNEYY